MLTKEPTSKMIEKWKAIFTEYKGKLHPNRRTSSEIIHYLKTKYPVVEETDPRWSETVIDNVLLNKHFAEKLPPARMPTVVVFRVLNDSTARQLYLEQDEVFKGLPIMVGIELETGFFHLEGSSELWDELVAFRGLDEADLKNFYLVAEYINCLKKFDRLEEVLSEQ